MAPFRRERLRFFFPDFFFSFLFQTETKKTIDRTSFHSALSIKKKERKESTLPGSNGRRSATMATENYRFSLLLFLFIFFVVVEFRRPFLDFLFFNKKKRRKKQNGRESEVARRWRFFQFLFLVPLRFSD